jgi:predicted nucleic acid-binding protein
VVIVLDTNVVCELLRPGASQAVIDWTDAQDTADLVITAITAAEIRAGVALLAAGRRRDEIGAWMEALITDTFAGHVLAFDVDSSPHYARILATRTRAGRPISGLDAQIAAVCAQHDATLATRNTTDFDGVGLDLINPWEPPATTPRA